jgi:hypothetical protein
MIAGAGSTGCHRACKHYNVVHVQMLAVLQSLVTDGAETLLPPRQLARATGRSLGSAPPLRPVVL